MLLCIMLHRDNLTFTISTEYFVRLSIFADGIKSFMFQWLLYILACLQVKILHSAHTVYLCVLSGPQNKQQVFPYTTISVWYLQQLPLDYRSVNQTIYCSIISKGAVPRLSPLDFDVRLRRPAFDWRSFHQGIVVCKVAMKLVFF